MDAVFLETVIRRQVEAAAEPPDRLGIVPDGVEKANVGVGSGYVGIARMNHQRHAHGFEAASRQFGALAGGGGGIYSSLAAILPDMNNPPFDFAVVDEAQDINVSQLRFLAALGEERTNALFFAGDLGQRIFQQPFSWKSLGVDMRGRSRTLRVNYRTSHQIRMQADRLLAPEITDIDGNREDRTETISIFNGPAPVIQAYPTETEESSAVANWLAEGISDGLLPHEMAVFVRSAAEIGRAQTAVSAAGLPFKLLDEHVETASGLVSICTMHLAKGLEFPAVAVMACDDEVIPSQQRIETVGDDADLQEVYDTERHLLYVACTRARDHLLVTSGGPASEFLDDLLC